MPGPLLDPAIYGNATSLPKPKPKVGGPIRMNELSKPAKAIFERWPTYIATLGHKPEFFYVTRKQAEILNRSLGASCTLFTFDGLPIKVYE